jgi:hypothetical protein
MCHLIQTRYSCGHPAADEFRPCPHLLRAVRLATYTNTISCRARLGRDLSQDLEIKCPPCHKDWLCSIIAQWKAEWEELEAWARATRSAYKLRTVLCAQDDRRKELAEELGELERAMRDWGQWDIYQLLPKWMAEQLASIKIDIGFL